MQDHRLPEDKNFQEEWEEMEKRMDEDDRRDQKEMKKSLIAGLVFAGCLIAVVVGILLFFVKTPGQLKGNTVSVTVTSDHNVLVPKVIGASQEDAETALQKAEVGCRVIGQKPSKQPYGTILEQSPAAGSEIERNGTIEVVISSGASTMEIPKNVVGQPVDDAVKRLQEAGFTSIAIEKAVSSQYDVGCVSRVTPNEGGFAMTTDKVKLTVSCGRKMKDVESGNYIGMSESEAELKAQRDGLTPRVLYGNSDLVEDGCVMEQSLDPDETVTSGTDIILRVNSTRVKSKGARNGWGADIELERPATYQDNQYRLVLVQSENGIVFEHCLKEDALLNFPVRTQITGIENVKDGTVYLYEKIGGNWIRRAEWKVQFGKRKE